VTDIEEFNDIESVQKPVEKEKKANLILLKECRLIPMTMEISMKTEMTSK